MVKIFEIKNYDTWHANAYVLYDEHNCILVDPCHIDDRIDIFVSENKLVVKAIILTHAHFDHITAVDYYINKYHCEFLMHWGDAKLLEDPYRNCSFMVDEEITVNAKPTYVEDEQILNILDEPIKIIYTPYHTNGGICLYIDRENILISGDSLFNGGTGRADLPTGNVLKMRKSLDKLRNLPKETIVYPGHGENTTILREFNNN